MSSEEVALGSLEFILKVEGEFILKVEGEKVLKVGIVCYRTDIQEQAH
jgi:hypothetical protein